MGHFWIPWPIYVSSWLQCLTSQKKWICFSEINLIKNKIFHLTCIYSNRLLNLFKIFSTCCRSTLSNEMNFIIKSLSYSLVNYFQKFWKLVLKIKTKSSKLPLPFTLPVKVLQERRYQILTETQEKCGKVGSKNGTVKYVLNAAFLFLLPMLLLF